MENYVAEHYYKEVLECIDNEHNRALYDEIVATTLFAPTPQIRLLTTINIVMEKFVPECDELMGIAMQGSTEYFVNDEGKVESRNEIFTRYQGWKQDIVAIREQLEREHGNA